MTTDIGRVTSVVPAPEEKRIYVSVKLSPDEYIEEIPFATGKTGLWMVPEEGDIVEVYEVGFESYVARTPHNPTPLTMPDLSQGDFCLKLNEDTELTFSKQADDTYDLSIKTDGTVNVTAPEVNVGSENGSPKPVAREGDPISGTGKDGASVTGQIDSGSTNVNST
jgi:hypothetical protein